MIFSGQVLKKDPTLRLYGARIPQMCLKIYKNSFYADKDPTLWLYGVIIPPKYVCKYIKIVFMLVRILLFGYIELEYPKNMFASI